MAAVLPELKQTGPKWKKKKKRPRTSVLFSHFAYSFLTVLPYVCKGGNKRVPIHVLKTCRGSEGAAPLILIFGTKRKLV
jgi:hypothetical protein